MDPGTSLRAKVEKVVGTTHVVTRPISRQEAERFGLAAGTSITFGQELIPSKHTLAPGQLVDLSGLVRFEKGWRASEVALVTATATAVARSTK